MESFLVKNDSILHIGEKLIQRPDDSLVGPVDHRRVK